eukprot:jgi/Mesvir1/12270/Mv00480-RA.1
MPPAICNGAKDLNCGVRNRVQNTNGKRNRRIIKAQMMQSLLARSKHYIIEWASLPPTTRTGCNARAHHEVRVSDAITRRKFVWKMPPSSSTTRPLCSRPNRRISMNVRAQGVGSSGQSGLVAKGTTEKGKKGYSPSSPPPPALDELYIGTSFGESLLNAVNILLGVGVLSIPFAMSEGGWSSLGVLALLGLVTNHTGKLLGVCQERVCLLPDGPNTMLDGDVNGLQSYEDIGDAAFGDAGRQFVTWVVYTELVGTLGLFFILEGDNIARILGSTDHATWMYLSALVIIPTTWLPDLKALAALGALGLLAVVGLTGVLSYYFFTGQYPAGAETTLVSLNTLPLTFGLLAFVFAGHAVFPNIKASMQEPEKYDLMLDYAYGIVGAVCAFVGVLGYTMFGKEVNEELTLSLPAGLLTTIAMGLVVVNPFTKFALTLDPVGKGVERLMGWQGTRSSRKKDQGILLPPEKIAVRTGLSLVALLMAAKVPFFGLVMALIGSCLTLGVSVVLPAACYLKLFEGQLTWADRAVNYGVIVVGMVCALSGTYVAIQSLVEG